VAAPAAMSGAGPSQGAASAAAHAAGMQDQSGYRGRFAPSPTGPLHFGSLVAAMASYADARAARGQWLLRIEDVDEPRTRAGAADAILAALERLGFEWDGEVWRQSARRDAYDAALAQLAAQGLVYRCACTRRELATAMLGPIGERVYPGTCRGGLAGVRALRRRASLRVRVPLAPVEFVDRLHGANEQRLAEAIGDFIVRRSDGFFAYQLAVVVDDAAQQITDVVRGADLLASTPRQIFLQRALGLPTPRYMHVPVAVDASEAKLSKAAGAAALPAAALPALRAAWRFLGQAAPRDPHSSVREFWSWAIASWQPARLPPVTMRRV
jgi:glutamyl-Q tRNA(Asp) synthetase